MLPFDGGGEQVGTGQRLRLFRGRSSLRESDVSYPSKIWCWPSQMRHNVSRLFERRASIERADYL